MRRTVAICVLTLALATTAQAVVPPAPTKPVASCVTVGTQCYVAGPFTLTTSSAGAHHFKVCRSNNTLGWGGCDFVMSNNTGLPYTVTDTNLPSNGYRRAYRFSACDSANNCTAWAANPETYVTMDTTPPTAPGATTAVCTTAVSGPAGCWVTGAFQISATAASDTGSGVDPNGYRICRSNDSTGGFAGCETTMTLSGTTSITVSGSHLPSDGYRRAYYFRAKDNVGTLGAWNTPLYVRVDGHDPTVSANNASPNWFTSRTATVSAGDAVGGAGANSGLKDVRYRWNAALNSTCTTGTATSNGAVLTAPVGDNTLYLCAVDYTGRVTQWSGGPYRVTVNYGLAATGLLPYTFGCGTFCGACGNGFGYAYDPNVIERNGTLEVFVQGATMACQSGQAHDTIVEGKWTWSGVNWFGERLGEVSAHTGGGCSASAGDLNPAAGPDVLLNPRTPYAGDRILFYSRGNADAYRGKLVSAHELNSIWNLEDNKFLLYPLCYESQPTGTDPCTQFGVARVAAIERGSYYYLYFEMVIHSDRVPLPPGVTPFGQRWGIFLMRVPKTSSTPYVAFGSNQAQLFNPSNNTWNTLPFQTNAPYGYYADFCNGLVTTGTFNSWRLPLGAAVLGDVAAADSGELIITYKSVGGPAKEVLYKRSFDPTFTSNVSSGSIDLSSISAQINTTHYPALHPQPGTGEYILFFSNFITGHGTSEIRSARVVLTPLP